ncbi:MAG: thioesterase family protein [Scytonema sp. PMC 1070.18]|nr:thioesterase family protein [Scytonema sp. PMC 1070.18]
MQRFKTLLRVRHYEMDALGHVNNSVYQNYLEQAAIEHSEYIGLTFEKYRELGGVFVMRRVEIDYLRPAVAGETLEITTWLREMRGTRAYRQYEIRKQNQEDLLVSAEALWVWVDRTTMRPRPIPNFMLERFLQIQQVESVSG